MRNLIFIHLLLGSCLITGALSAQTVKLTLDLGKEGVVVSPTLYGLMTEEINHSYDGGLYAELIRNRIFKDNPRTPDNWSLLEEGGGKGTMQLDTHQPINDALTVCLKLDVGEHAGRVGIVNEGYWGIPVKPKTTYRASFYARAGGESAGPLTVSIESNDGKVVYATAPVIVSGTTWKKYEATLQTGDVAPTAAAHFVISTKAAGIYWFNLVSLFPPTYNNRPNGNRIDIMQLLADMKPGFLRFPGGNYLEGDLFATRFPWKKTLGGLEERPGHPGCWSYPSSDGMGLLEFLEWCEDLKMQPLLAVYAGYTLKKDHMDAGPFLAPFVDEALEEIEYVIGDVHTKWGARRAQDGHPQPFVLNYVEVGNEDGFDQSGSYDLRFGQFYDAIKAKYPQLKVISTIGGRDGVGGRFKIKSRVPEAIDEHYYRNAVEMEEDASHYDNYDRNSPRIFVGEWATREGSPTPNMNAALGDAAWMTGMERNSDHVVMSCYAPLFVNVNPGGMQWKSDLIGYNTLISYGSPSYYAQKMFNGYLGNRVVPMKGENIPMQTRPPNRRDSANGVLTPKSFPSLFYVATRDGGKIYLKIVNASGEARPVVIDLAGVAGKVAKEGTLVVLKGSGREDTNTIDEPAKIVPVTSMIKGIGKTFTRMIDPYSVNVLQLQVQ
jgi:alpha-N-arabinofuranosidase